MRSGGLIEEFELPRRQVDRNLDFLGFGLKPRDAALAHPDG